MKQEVLLRRRFGAALTVVVAVLVVAPSLAMKPKDSYPLSTYPMFAKARGKPQVHQLVGVQADGSRVAIPPALLGTSEVLQAKVLIRHAVKGGRKQRKKLCEAVAERARKSPEFSQLLSIELVAARYDAIDYLVSAPKPISRRRLSRCPVQPKAKKQGKASASGRGQQ